QVRLSHAQAAASEAAIRATQVIRNEGGRLWMAGPGVRATDLQTRCSRLAPQDSFAAQLTSHARHAAAARAWAAMERFATNGRQTRPGPQGPPRFQRPCRSVESQQTGWRVAADGPRLPLTDGGGRGQVRLRLRLMGSRDLSTVPREPITRLRLRRRADGSY